MSHSLFRFLQAQYGFTSGMSAVIVGLMAVPMGGGGTFVGGYITKRLRLTRSGVIKFYMYFQCVTVPCALGFVIFHCGSLPFSGVNQLYWGMGTEPPPSLTDTGPFRYAWTSEAKDEARR
jgi:hypothetical protein